MWEEFGTDKMFRFDSFLYCKSFDLLKSLTPVTGTAKH